jgi:hypothetical protein
MSSEQMYKEKYLKYKKKYSTLKKQIDGGAGSSYFKQMVLATGSLGSQTSRGKRTVSNLFLKALEIRSSVKKMTEDLRSFNTYYKDATESDREAFASYKIRLGTEKNPKYYVLSYPQILKFITLLHEPYNQTLIEFDKNLIVYDNTQNIDSDFIPGEKVSYSDWHRVATDINDNYASMSGSIYQGRNTGIVKTNSKPGLPAPAGPAGPTGPPS